MSPFDTQHLPQLATTWGDVWKNPTGRPASPNSKARQILERLRQGPASTVELAELVGVAPAQIHTILWRHRTLGMVMRPDKKVWALNPAYLSAKIANAAEVLRAAGWTVIAP